MTSSLGRKKRSNVRTAVEKEADLSTPFVIWLSEDGTCHLARMPALHTTPRERLVDLLVGVTLRLTPRTHHRNTENQKRSFRSQIIATLGVYLHLTKIDCRWWRCPHCWPMHHSVVGRTLMTSGDMLEYLYHTQTISVKCRQTTRVVIIYIGCD
jgi:hypothetical protein